METEADQISIEEIFDTLSSEMIKQFEVISKKLSTALRRDIRESRLREMLRRYLPSFLGVGRGQIMSATTKNTEELDLVIYDESKCPVFPVSNDITLFPVEGVYAVVEVESNLTKERLRHLIGKIKAIKAIPKTAYYPDPLITKSFKFYGKDCPSFPIVGAIFAFDSVDTNELVNELRRIYSEDKIELENQIDLICILPKGVLLHTDQEGKSIVFPSQPNSEVRRTPPEFSSGRNLLLFYLLLANVLVQASMLPINILAYSKLLKR